MFFAFKVVRLYISRINMFKRDQTGHPEFTPDIVNRILDVRSNTVVMDAETAADGRARAVKRDDGVGTIGKAIWKVIGVDATT